MSTVVWVMVDNDHCDSVIVEKEPSFLYPLGNNRAVSTADTYGSIPSGVVAIVRTAIIVLLPKHYRPNCLCG